MIHRRTEGAEALPGFNYTKTGYGHGLVLFIHLPRAYRLMAGYYWGIKFKLRFNIWSQTKQDEWWHDLRSNDDL